MNIRIIKRMFMKRKLKDVFSIEFYNQWSSFSPKPMNWRDFTWILFRTETNCYSRYFEIELGILGLVFTFNIWRKTFEEREKELNEWLKQFNLKDKTNAKTFEIDIREILSNVVTVEADTLEEAILRAETGYETKEKGYTLDSTDFFSVEYIPMDD